MPSTNLLQRLLSRIRGGISPAAPLDGQPWQLPQDPEARREAARWAYRLILLREPESREVVDFLVSHTGSPQAMRNMLLESAEARAKPGFPVALSMDGNEPPQPVQVRVSDEEAAQLFARVQEVWHALGEVKPHWSVVTADQFRPDNIAASLDHFYATGETNIATVLRTLERNEVDWQRLKRCMDFGCGVGRLTAALARRFEHVHGVDVSASHLEIAREALEKRAPGKVTLHHLERIDAVEDLPSVDFLLSLIVLQHNPPPVMRVLLAGLLGRLRSGGVAVIQIPTYLPAGYRFDVGEYIAGEGRDMEMHALPQREVFAVARAAGVDVLEVLDDTWTGYGIGSRSNTFVMRRPD